MESIEITASKLLAEAEWHKEIARKLTDAADAIRRGPSEEKSEKPHKNTIPPLLGRATRLKELKEFLIANPGKKRSEIIENTKIPEGTLGFLLKRENGLEKRNMRWYVSGTAPQNREEK